MAIGPVTVTGLSWAPGANLWIRWNDINDADNDHGLAIDDVMFSAKAGVVAGVQGDYNGNGVVDAADYVIWRKGGPLQNEVDNVGTVNDQDYIEWRNRFGNVSGSGSGLSGAAVPEPSVMALFSLASGGFFIGRSKRGGANTQVKMQH